MKKMKWKAVSAQGPTYYFLNKPDQLQNAWLHWCQLCFLFCRPLSGCSFHSCHFYLQFLSIASSVQLAGYLCFQRPEAVHGYVADMWRGDRAPFKYGTGMFAGCETDFSDGGDQRVRATVHNSGNNSDELTPSYSVFSP